MKFAPKSEADLQKEASKFGPWPNGIYDFEVTDAEDQTSKAGNDMIVLTLAVFNADGERRLVYDYLLEAMAAKLHHAAGACGLSAEYEAGSLSAHDFYGKTGRLKLGIQAARDNFPARNTVRDYIAGDAPKLGAPKPSAAPAMADLDDEIPF